MEQKLKLLEFIQGVINRLATNSFQMKGWSVVLVAAILVLLARENRLNAAFIALAPILAFGGLDGYFLHRERLFRALYDHVRTLDDAQIDFPMDVRLFKIGYNLSCLGATLSSNVAGTLSFTVNPLASLPISLRWGLGSNLGYTIAEGN